MGRGAIAGPVCVGAVAIVPAGLERPFPEGLDDSKVLTAAKREALVPAIEAWASGFALGWASPGEIDEAGIIGALRWAAQRALAGLGRPEATVILDGSHDWLTPPPATLDEASAGTEPAPPAFARVVTLVQADRRCATVAAASVLAKCARDAEMERLDARHPGYGWASNKGYGTAAHQAAIGRLGPSPQHRLTWHLGDTDGPDVSGTRKTWQASSREGAPPARDKGQGGA